MSLLKICWHYSNVPMNSVYVAKFIANIGENANVTCVTFKSGTWVCHKIGDFSTVVLK